MSQVCAFWCISALPKLASNQTKPRNPHHLGLATLRCSEKSLKQNMIPNQMVMKKMVIFIPWDPIRKQITLFQQIPKS